MRVCGKERGRRISAQPDMQADIEADPQADMSVYRHDFFVLWTADRGNTMSEPAA